MKTLLLSIFSLFATILSTTAQKACGTTEYKQQLLAADPSLNVVFKTIEKQVASFNGNLRGNVARRDTAANETIYIPVIIHVLYKTAAENISDAQIKSQIDVLNNDFNMLNSDRVNTPAPFKLVAGEARIKFCLAQVDPQGNRTTGIERKYTSTGM